MGSAPDGVVGFQPGAHFGNVGREFSSILAPLMDVGFLSSDDSKSVSRYGTDFKFFVVLSYEKFSHRREGYSVKILLRTDKSVTWVSNFFAFLSEALETSGSIPILL